MRKTKIVCTLGPSTDKGDVLRQLIMGGMNVARFNFSHGDHAGHLARMNKLKEIREELNIPLATLLDTRGPEIRIGNFKEGSVSLKKGDMFTLTTRMVEGDSSIVHVNYPDIINDVSIGGRILIDDGLVGMRINELTDTDILCTVENDGVISDKKGVNLPNCEISMPFISERDREDIIFGIEQGFDFIAASFVRTAADIMEIRKILNEFNCNTIDIIAKIENMQGVENIDEIIRVSDGIMVARGDLGVEIPLEEIPVIQKDLISKAFNSERRVITATQMLDSMMKNPRPTRAEATDVANAIYDGTSAIMLSGETAAGAYPVEALMTMDKIARYTEENINYIKRFKNRESDPETDVTNAIAHATCMTAIDLSATAIITVTKSGNTAKLISKYRPMAPIIGCTMSASVYRQLSMSWGVIPMLINEENDTDTLFGHAIELAMEAGYLKAGDLTVITAGVPLGISGTTNLLKVAVAGNVLLEGKSIGDAEVTAPAIVCKSIEELREKYKDNCIIVVPDTDNTVMSQLKGARGIIVETKDPDSHAAIVGLSLDIPVLYAADHACDIITNGSIITLNAKNGLVYAT